MKSLGRNLELNLESVVELAENPSPPRLINFVIDTRAVLSEKHLGTKFYTLILNWTLELLKLNIKVL